MDAGLALTCVYCHVNGYCSDLSSGLITVQMDASLLIHLRWSLCVDIGLAIHPGWLWMDTGLVTPMGWVLCEWILVHMIAHLGWLLCEWALLWSQLWVHNCAEGHHKWVRLSLIESPLHTKPVLMFGLSSFEISLYPFAKFLKHCIFLKHCVFLGPGYL